MPDPAVDATPVLDPLETIASRGFGRYDVFRDWVRLMLAALQRDDDQYLSVLDAYKRGRDRDRGERNADLFAAAFGELQELMGETNRDVLGEAYERWGMQSEQFGQHFTPHNVAASMVELQATVDDPDPPVTIGDPACGSGRLLVLAARQHDVKTFSYGQDKDPLCAQMAALNLCFFNMDGVVIAGDSLTLEKRQAWRTKHTLFGGEVVEVDPETVPLPEAAFEDVEDAGEDESDPEPAERLAVDAPEMEQADVTGWSDD